MFDEQLEVVEAKIAERAAADEQAKLLESMPGMGHYSAVAIASRIGKIERFKRPGSLANYFGLTPGCRNSGEATQRLGSITKRGSRLLKCTMQDCTMGENRSTLVTVLIRRFGARIPAAPRQLDVSPGPGPMARRNSDYGAARSPAGRSNRFYRCRADRARARTRPTVRGRPRRDGLRHGRMQKRTTEQTSQIKS
jgi:hypothetical protein